MEGTWRYSAPLGHRLVEKSVKGGRGLSLQGNRMLVLVLTFLCYAAYHASRKPPSIVKSVLNGESAAHNNNNNGMMSEIDTESNPDVLTGTRKVLSAVESVSYVVGMDLMSASSAWESTAVARQARQPRSAWDRSALEKKKHRHHENTTTGGWAPFNNPKIGKSLLGDLDLAFLGSYALGMFVSGHLGDRVDLRYFLTGGMLGSGICVCLFGAAYFWNIHTMSYFISVQVVGGLLQATGWPSVVSVMANWFGKGKRGLIMGVWNAHTSVGNIAGSLLAAYMLQYGWGYSFIVPGALIAGVGVLIFLFLVVEPQDIGFLPQSGSALGSLAPSAITTPRGTSGGMMSPSERATLERRVAQLAEQHNGMVPARVTQSMEAHHHLHPPTGKHGLLAMGSTLVLVNDRRESVEGSEAGDNDDREALLGGSPNSQRTWVSEREKPGTSFLAAWCIPGVAVYAFTLFFAKLVAYTFLYWLPYYISSTQVGGRALSPTEAGNLSILFDVGGVLGGVLAGYLSDQSSSPAIVSCSFVYLAIPCLYLYRAYGELSFSMNITLMMLAGFFVNGPYALITTAVSADLGSSNVGDNEKALATVTAIIDGMGSIGAALGPMMTGYISELPGGFDNVFMMLYASALCAGLLLSGLVLRELGELLGISSKRESSSLRHGGSKRGNAMNGGDEENLGLLDASEVINSASFSYLPPGENDSGTLRGVIDNERGVRRGT